MKKSIYIYDNDRNGMGVYASEQLTKSYSGGDCEEVVIEIPDEMEPGSNCFGQTIVTIGGYDFALDELLAVDKNDRPYLKPTKDGENARFLKIVERKGRKSLSFTI